LPYEYDDAGTIYRHKGTVPGFRCLACGNEFVSDAVGWMLMAAVLERLPDASERKRTLARQVRALEESAGRSPSSLSTQVGA
jgi:hypothetical protein